MSCFSDSVVIGRKGPLPNGGGSTHCPPPRENRDGRARGKCCPRKFRRPPGKGSPKPHQALGTEGRVDTLDERRQIQVRRLLGAQGVKGRNLHLDLAMAAQLAQGFDVRFGDGARGADAGQVIDHDRRIGESVALPPHSREGIRADKRAQCEALLGSAAEHFSRNTFGCRRITSSI
jgi:hypothetical protein